MIERNQWIERRATIVQHCAVFGRLETKVRAFNIGEVEPYAQYPVSVSVGFKAPRKRKVAFYTMHHDPDGHYDTRFLTIEADGEVLYDSRSDVPCDRANWERVAARFAKQAPLCEVSE